MKYLRLGGVLFFVTISLSACYQEYKPNFKNNNTAIIGFRYDPVNTPKHLESLHYFPGDYFIYTYPETFCEKPQHIGNIESINDRVDTIVQANKKFNIHLVYIYKKYSGRNTSKTSCNIALSFTPEKDGEYEVVIGNDNKNHQCQAYVYRSSFKNDEEIMKPVTAQKHYGISTRCVGK